MKNNIFTLFVLSLMVFAFIPANALPANAGLNSISFDKTTINFGGSIKQTIQSADSFTITYNTDADTDIYLEYVSDSDSTGITLTRPSTITLNNSNNSDATKTVSISALASRDQLVTFDKDLDTKFGGIIYLKRTSSPAISESDAHVLHVINVRTAVLSDYFDIRAELDDDKYKPGDEIDFEINNFENIKSDNVENIDVTITIEDLDEGDNEIDFTVDVGDLDKGDEDDITETIEIPLNTDDRNYDIDIEIEFDDENGNGQTIKGVWRNAFEVEKKNKHDAELSSFSINQLSPVCGAVLTVDAAVTNTGRNDLDGVFLLFRIEGTNEEERTSRVDLDSNKGEDRDARRSATLTVPKDLEPGDYVVGVEAWFDDDGDDVEIASQRKSISVRCDSFTQPTDTTDDEVIETTTDVDRVTGSTVYTPTGTFGSFFEAGSVGSTIFWIFVDLILLLLVIWLLKVIFRKSK